MKYLLIALVVGVLGIIAFNSFGTVSYESTEPVEKVTTLEVDMLKKQIEEAITASSTVIETEAKKAYDEKKSQMELEVELSVTRKFREELEARESELEEKVSF